MYLSKDAQRELNAPAETAMGLLLQRPSSFDDELWARIDKWNTALLGDHSERWRACRNAFVHSLKIDKKLADTLQTLKDGELELPKDRFWRFVNAVAQDYRHGTGGDFHSLCSVDERLCPMGPLPSDPAQQFFISLDQQRVSALLWDDLSNRDIRAILGSVAEEIGGMADTGSPLTVVLRVHDRLFREIELRVQKQLLSAPPPPPRIDDDALDVRARVFTFIVHTGISPPTSAVWRPATGWTLFDTAAQKVPYEVICRREARSNLPHPLCGGSAQTHHRARARNRAAPGGRAQPARCRRNRSNYSLAQFP
jgi:hypothetical protein